MFRRSYRRIVSICIAHGLRLGIARPLHLQCPGGSHTFLTQILEPAADHIHASLPLHKILVCAASVPVSADPEQTVQERTSRSIRCRDRASPVEIKIAMQIYCIAIQGIIGGFKMAVLVQASLRTADGIEIQSADETTVFAWNRSPTTSPSCACVTALQRFGLFFDGSNGYSRSTLQ